MTTTANAVEVPVPDIGAFSHIPVIEVLVSVGDKVNADDPVITLDEDAKWEKLWSDIFLKGKKVQKESE